jgi:hypothetical protein
MQGWLSSTKITIINVLLSVMILINLLGCLWWAVAATEGLEHSWAAHVSGGCCHAGVRADGRAGRGGTRRGMKGWAQRSWALAVVWLSRGKHRSASQERS